MIDKIFNINQILLSTLGFFIITILLHYWNKFIIKEWYKFSADESDQYVSRNPNSTRQSIPLTQEEYTFARNLKIKMPDGTYRSISPEDLNRFYDSMKKEKKFKNIILNTLICLFLYHLIRICRL